MMARFIIVEAPAKINLILDIIGRRPDGYHELETVMHQVDLCDRLFMEEYDRGIAVASNNEAVPGGEGNLAYRAAQLVLGKYGKKAGVKIFIEKNIPVAAGLAGGSTDAAAVMLGLNQLYALDIPQGELMCLGLKLGSDIPYCMAGGPLREKMPGIMAPVGVTCLARGRGEILTQMPSLHLKQILIVKPDHQLSTAEIYNGYRAEKVTDRPVMDEFVRSWKQEDIRSIAANLGNVLESVSIKKLPLIETIKDQLKAFGALNAVMSGSGPSVFGLFDDEEKAGYALNMLKEQYRETYLVSSY